MLKKNFTSGIIIGVITGVALFSGAALAVQSPIKLIVNGQNVQSDVPPQVINGRTMVPARPLAEALGAKVQWDSKNRAVIVTSQEINSESPTDLEPSTTTPKSDDKVISYLGSDIEPMNYQEGSSSNAYGYPKGNTIVSDWNFRYKMNLKDNTGKSYDKFVALYLSYGNQDEKWNSIDFPLNGEYNSFKTTLALTDDFKNIKEPIHFQILLDGKVAYSKTVKAGDFPEAINLNVKDVKKLTFKTSADAEQIYTDGYDIEIGLFDARLTKN
ncbi:stalk domain-containing protein [Aneurinibacillus danicus]|uniref:stalk domain-containing protein n=1 Tax=Aneurinibacillus danicus TaxID=267746 RepID=UPI0014789C17|nr:stalk domain-containing protein [Aneurinibacillus danicus]